jgi:hypothetical protein
MKISAYVSSDFIHRLRVKSHSHGQDPRKESCGFKRDGLLRVRRGVTSLGAQTLPRKDYGETLPVSSIAAYCTPWYTERRFHNLNSREYEKVVGSKLEEWFENMKQRPNVETEEAPPSCLQFEPDAVGDKKRKFSEAMKA